LSAGETARINAYRKARAAAKKHPGAVVLGVDTVVALGAILFGKPATLEEAAQMLLDLQGKTHRVVTGVCLIHVRARRQRIFYEETAVTFAPLTREQIRSYHAQVNPLDKAGAYGIQEKGEMLVEAISGSFTNVVGCRWSGWRRNCRFRNPFAFGKSPLNWRHDAQILACR
jgi:septum formation protein